MNKKQKSEREEALDIAWNTPIHDLAIKVIRGGYMPGVDDYVLLTRIERVQEMCNV